MLSRAAALLGAALAVSVRAVPVDSAPAADVATYPELAMPAGGWNAACSVNYLKTVLPSNAQLVSAVKVPQGGTYGEGPADVAYPVDPTNLPELCAVIVKVTSSPSSSFRFGLFLPTKWNCR